MKDIDNYQIHMYSEIGIRVTYTEYLVQHKDMKDKLELQKQYIEVKNKYDELSELYWSASGYLPNDGGVDNYLEGIKQEIKDQFMLLKSINKQLYYGENN